MDVAIVIVVVMASKETRNVRKFGPCFEKFRLTTSVFLWSTKKKREMGFIS